MAGASAPASTPLVNDPGHNRVVQARRERFLPELRELFSLGRIAIIDLRAGASGCGEACVQQVDRWKQWLAEYFVGTHPAAVFHDVMPPDVAADTPLLHLRVPAIALAMLSLSSNYDDYLKRIGAKSRNMLRKAERTGYRYGPVVWNDRLDEIHEINLSKPERGGIPMTEEYRAFPPRLKPEPIRGCLSHNFECYGCFREERLVAYCAVHYCGDLAVIRNILGHAAHLPNGVMNGLVGYMARAGAMRGTAKYLNYLTLHSRTRELDGFKRRVGFDAKAVLFAWP